MKEKTRDAIRAAWFEAAFVVLGVILAFAANEWRQARSDDRQARQALATILEELTSNRAAVAESMEYHQGLLEMLHADHEEGWVPGPRQFNRGFISPARISRTAWDSASETGVLAKTEYDVVVELSGIYAQQERYEVQARSAGEIIYGELFRGGTGAIARNYRNLATLIHTFSYRERELLESYDETLQSLEAAD